MGRTGQDCKAGVPESVAPSHRDVGAFLMSAAERPHAQPSGLYPGQ